MAGSRQGLRQVNKHQRMVREIEAEVRYTSRLLGKDALREEVIQAMQSVPRDEFVPEESKALAFYDGPLSIGYGQTISQPYIVAVMTDLLNPQPGDIVMEVGTGSGYQAAILSRLAGKVYSIEIIPELAELARARLQRLGISNVEVIVGNGYFGCTQYAPFDGVMVTAAASHISTCLVEQLKPGHRLVIPVGQPFAGQELTVVEKGSDGAFTKRTVMGVVFVPLTHENEH